MFHHRHPLQELIVDTFVPNDAYFVGGAGFGVVLEDDVTNTELEDKHRYVKNSVVICTGANACGKVSLLICSRCLLTITVDTEHILEASAFAFPMLDRRAQ